VDSEPNLSLPDLAIALIDGKQEPWGPIDNLSKKEFETLRDYLET
jgi:hypothetical protein